MPTFELAYGSKTDIGAVRRENQDNLGKRPEHSLDPATKDGQLFVVADGMGGHRGGKEASGLAVQTVIREYERQSGSVEDRLRKAIEAANEEVFRISMTNPAYRGMGTTCTALVIQGQRAVVGHIGDSRAYRITGGDILQITQDHSKVAEMLRRGILTEEEARVHPERSMLYRALGVSPVAEVDVVAPVEVQPGDLFLLCTDGLINHVDDEEILELASGYSPQEACERLVALAIERGGFDNITVQIIAVSPDKKG